MWRNFEYAVPATLSEAIALLRRQDARPVAGGTDLTMHLRAGVVSPAHLVDLSGLGLNYIRTDGETVKIGAMTTVAALLAAAEIGRNFPALLEAALEFGSVQTRNMATVGGNLCSAVPSADLAPPLLVLGAQVRLAGAGGDRALPLTGFFTGPRQTVLRPAEILTEIELPLPPPRSGSSFLKLGRRNAMTLAIVNAAAFIALEEDGRTVRTARLALGAVAPTPIRATNAETLLRGRPLSDSLIEEAAAAAALQT
ncbi:MAG: xanthine dehydrogenase family protein subunit M, partial [Caldilineae bacterium]